MKSPKVLQLNDLSPRFEIKNNSFVFPYNLSCSQLHIERSALTIALKENLGIIYSTSTIDSEALNSIKNQCEDAGKKVFLISFTEPTTHNGLNPFLILEPAQIAQFYFKAGSKEYEQLTAEFKNNTEPTTPEVVLKIIRQNQALFTNKAFACDLLVKNLEAIVSSINPFSNTDKTRNVDLSSIINDGHVLIFGGLNDPLLADEFKAFINDYFLNPVFVNNQINTARNNKTYIITSSESAIDPKFTEKVFAYGRQLNMQGLYTEHRTDQSQYESIHLIYANSQNKIKGGSAKQKPSIKDNYAEEALKIYLENMDGSELNMVVA